MQELGIETQLARATLAIACRDRVASLRCWFAIEDNEVRSRLCAALSVDQLTWLDSLVDKFLEANWKHYSPRSNRSDLVIDYIDYQH